jgi:hypothetical protein
MHLLHLFIAMLGMGGLAVGVMFQHQGAFDNSACIDVLKAIGCWVTPDNTPYTGSTDALIYPGLAILNSAGVDACTLATPVAGAQNAGGDDGKILTVLDVGGHAHTITTAANAIVPSHHVLTFNGTKGSYIDLMAYNGVWYVQASIGVTAS